MNSHNIPGLTYIGEISNPAVNNGQALPFFECKEPTERPSINTVEGWNALCRKQDRKHFVRVFGREPVDDSELDAYTDACNKCYM